MRGLNWNKFSNGEIAVNCRTRTEANEFLKECDDRGYTWSMGMNLLKNLNWDGYKKETCYRVTGNKKISYANTEFYEAEKNVEIMTFTDIINEIKEPVEANDMGQLIKQLKKMMNDADIEVMKAKGIMIITDEKMINGL